MKPMFVVLGMLVLLTLAFGALIRPGECCDAKHAHAH